MKKVMLTLGLVAMLALAASSAWADSISPAGPNGPCDEVYGNTIIIGSTTGEAGTIWNRELSTAAMIGKLYAVDSQAVDQVTWTQNQADWRPLMLSSTGTWANGAITHKFAAPTDMAFSGGRLGLTCGGIWGGGTVKLHTSSGYGNSGWGVLALSGIFETVTIDMPTAWSSYTGWIDVPTGVSEFYLSIEATDDYKTAWGQQLTADAVTVAAVPEPATLALLTIGGLGLLKRRG